MRGVPRPDNAGPRRSLSEQFWDKVDVRGTDDCWEWKGAKYAQGYGKLVRVGLWLKAHRVSYELHHGEIPAGLWVLHHCDNPSCVNPAHLYAGTHQDNCSDRARRGRGKEHRQHGPANDNAKLSNEQVLEIRHRVAAGETQTAIAREFGISQPHVSRIVHRVSR